MEITKKGIMQTLNTAKSGFIDHLLEEGWTYIKTVVDIDIMNGPIIILDKDLRVMAVNESFYRMFKVEPKETEGKFIYEILGRKLNIPALRKLLEDILPENTFFKSFEITKDFSSIGNKTMILNAHQIYLKESNDRASFSPMIFLVMEDVTEMMAVAETIALHASKLEDKITKYTKKLEKNIEKLEKEIKKIKNKK
ncbi:MAG: PAS domain-containing protein [Candidatus Paceibacterota bacterium]